MRCDDVTSMFIQRHLGTKCPLGSDPMLLTEFNKHQKKIQIIALFTFVIKNLDEKSDIIPKTEAVIH